MNDLLHLKGRFEQAKAPNKPPSVSLPRNQSVKADKLHQLREQLTKQYNFWKNEKFIEGALISVYYIKIAAKSNRIQGLLCKSKSPSLSMVGARFSDDPSPKHIITHYIPLEVLEESIQRLDKALEILLSEFGDTITQEDLLAVKTNKVKLKDREISKTNFMKVIVDAFYVEKFDLYVDSFTKEEQSIITLFRTERPTVSLLSQLGIHISYDKIIDDSTVLLFPDELNQLKKKAPYLISMGVSDITKLTKDDFFPGEVSLLSIPSPENEPTVGVIDTMFDQSVYFSEWVEWKNMLHPDIPLSPNDFRHGTAVTSLIVDGPSFNPKLDDHLGRFRVRHFGVAKDSQFSSFTVLKLIDEIVTTNKDIKVWNLSLGSALEISKNFISPEAAILDRIQNENDVLFVISGTNKVKDTKKRMAIGSPADSINALVVNSVDFDGKPASYARNGPVLSFFTKPDVSYYGGEKGNPIRVCTPLGESFVAGTSFAAPWISRKLCYLIHVLGLSREAAKALLIHSTLSWEKTQKDETLIGYGIVPVTIEEVVQCKNDEIRFVIQGISEKYDTYNYNLPVPIYKNKHPFIAQATLCYFPHCSRLQGVDYTSTEFDFKFGRVKSTGVESLDHNNQGAQDLDFTYEADARRLYRKWDNVKNIRETLKKNPREKKVYERGTWGISIKTKERSSEKRGENMHFGLVVTLKEIRGVNRVDEFIKHCNLKGWLVNTISIENQINLFNIAEEEVHFDD